MYSNPETILDLKKEYILSIIISRNLRIIFKFDGYQIKKRKGRGFD